MSRVPFARFFKRLTIGRAIGIVALVGLGVGIKSFTGWVEVRSARTDLEKAVHAYRVDTNINLTELAYRIGKPMLHEYDRGRFEQRLSHMRHLDNRTSIQIVDALYVHLRTKWAFGQMDAAGLNWHNDNQRLAFLRGQSEYRRVERISDHLQELEKVENFAPHMDSIEEVRELTARFLALQVVTARLLESKPDTDSEG